MNVTVDFAIVESTVSKSSFMFQSMLAIAEKLGATHILFGISFNGRYQAQLYVAGDFVNLFFVPGNEGYWSDSAFGYGMYAPVVVENAQLAVKTFEEVYTMQGDVTDRHIALEEGIKWLARLGCTDVRAIGTYLLSGVDPDGYAFLTDIREHALSSVMAHAPAQVELVNGQYETYAQYADRLDNLRSSAPVDALQSKLEGYALIQLEHAHSVLPDGTAEFMAVQEELRRRESLPYVWSIQYFTSRGLEEEMGLEEYATLEEIRACMADIHTSHWEYHVSADGLQKVMYSSQLDFGFIHYVTRGGVIVAPYAYATPMEEGSVNLDQVPYDAQVVDAICAANADRLRLSDTQQKLMGEQLEYWGNRFDCAWDRADYDDCEFCACYVVALQAIFGTL